MEILKSIDSVRKFIANQKLKQNNIGFVPTMGALHEGHLQLVKNSLQNNDTTIVSIYVNPTQFNNIADFNNYPNTLSNDKILLKKVGCDALFLPDSDEIYPNKNNLSFNFRYLETIMEGKFRTGHFSSVALIISKLFNIVQPDKAYFGEKDLQQLVIIKKLTKDLLFNIEIIGMPIIREPSGLAMSSRNMRLSNTQSLLATNIFKGLTLAKKLMTKENKISVVKEKTELYFSNFKGLYLEYIEYVDFYSFTPLTDDHQKNNLKQKVSICIAAFIDDIRLIDNISFTI